jgi:hypothetical protein
MKCITELSEFLTAKRRAVGNIRVSKAFTDSTVSRNTVGWWAKCVRLSERRSADLDELHSSCPNLALATNSVHRADEIIQREQYVAYREL